LKTTPKNILLLTSEFPPLPGGIGNHAYYLSKYLQTSGYQITVLTNYRHTKDDITFDVQQAFKIIRIQRNAFTYVNRIIKAFSKIKNQHTVMASGKFSLWLGGLLSLFFKKNYIAILHGSELKAGGKLSQRLTKWSLKRFDKRIAVSNFTKSEALKINPKWAIEVINNGIEFKQPSQLPPKPEYLNLITVGQVNTRKGQQNVIKALPTLKAMFPNIHYHCVGIPTMQPECTQLATQLNVVEQITFHGAVSENIKNEWLQKSTVFIMLSEKVNNDFEGFGIAILEANAFGLPAIGAVNSGITDAVKEGVSGKLVNPHNTREIVDAVKDIYENYTSYSCQAVEWAAGFDWNVIIKKYIEVMEA
jgi:phosphatidylinositol alpha-1,6-mannosyltransferase